MEFADECSAPLLKNIYVRDGGYLAIGAITLAAETIEINIRQESTASSTIDFEETELASLKKFQLNGTRQKDNQPVQSRLQVSFMGANLRNLEELEVTGNCQLVM